MPKNKKKRRSKKRPSKRRTKNKKRRSNIYNRELKECSFNPLTGYFRDGYCTTDKLDHGTHTVCSRVTDDFLNYTKSAGNDLSTPRGSFPGLKDGDNWCLCALRWKEIYDFNPSLAPKIKLNATHKKTLDYIDKSILTKYSL